MEFSDKDDEYFESLEDILTTCTCEGQQSSRKARQTTAGERESRICPEKGCSLDSKYDVWTKDPGTIQERRQRLLQLMGLGDYRKSGESLLVEASGQDNDNEIHDGVFPRAHDVSVRSSEPSPPAAGPVDERLQIKKNQLEESCSSSLVDTCLERNCCSGPCGFGKEGPAHLQQSGGFYKILKMDHFLDGSGASDSPPHEGQTRSSSKRFSSSLEDGQTNFPNEYVESTSEIGCRIKNLDTGREYELGINGMWNELLEVDSGRVFSLDEFENSLGLSPLVEEVRRREQASSNTRQEEEKIAPGAMVKQTKRSWFMGIKALSKATKTKEAEKSQNTYRINILKDDPVADVNLSKLQKIKVRVNRKAHKELTELYMLQEFQGHQGPIWTLRFSTDGRYLASGGNDCVVRVWELKIHSDSIVQEGNDERSKIPNLGHAQANDMLDVSGFHSLLWWTEGRKTKTGTVERAQSTQISNSISLMQKAVCCFYGHSEDILDLAWSHSKFLLSSSMDKTVRLWHLSQEECLKIFTHNDYVTCIQFNPVDDRYFLSGSLDGKVRMWNIPEHQVVDWNDSREMITAACYTSDGEGALVGSHKGTCRVYSTTGNKLKMKTHIDVFSSNGKRSQRKKITGLQCFPGNVPKFLVTSSDSCIRVYDGFELSHKYKGFRNVESQIAASFAADAHYIVTASEDSRVYIWSTKDASALQKYARRGSNYSFENFYSSNVTAALPWPGLIPKANVCSNENSTSDQRGPGNLDNDTSANEVNLHTRVAFRSDSLSSQYFECVDTSPRNQDSEQLPHNVHLGGDDNGLTQSASTGPEKIPRCDASFQNDGPCDFLSEKNLLLTDSNTFSTIDEVPGTSSIVAESTFASWGLVIITASYEGHLRLFQNCGLPSQH